MPRHTHDFGDFINEAGNYDGYPDGWDDTSEEGGYWRYGAFANKQHNTTYSAGGGEDYMPPYITVYAWYRTA